MGKLSQDKGLQVTVSFCESKAMHKPCHFNEREEDIEWKKI
jgi:hypothetical protein